jgi:hypothetical protein
MDGRAKSQLPKDQEPPAPTEVRPAGPSGPQHSKPKRGPNPFVVAGAAFAVGTLLAKLIDWRGHAHPKR